MVGAIIVAVIGIVFITLGYLMWKKEKITLLHSYIHSFRFAQAQNVMKMVSLSLFFLYNSSCRELGILQITGR